MEIWVAWPRAASQRFMNLISFVWELLIRAPSERRFLFSVCEGIIAVISIAWAWCRIMPCMNSASAVDAGGRTALVEEGNFLLGDPGAPGCTTTDFGVSAFCAPAG